MKNNLTGTSLLFGLVCLLLGAKAFAGEQQVIASGSWKIVYNEGTKTCERPYWRVFLFRRKRRKHGCEARSTDSLLFRKKLSMMSSVPDINTHLPMQHTMENRLCNSRSISIRIKVTF